MAEYEPGVIHLDDPDVDELREDPNGMEVHLLLGDSIPHRMGERLAANPRDVLLNFTGPGETWASIAEDKDRYLHAWQDSADCFGSTGTCIVWMTGNDVYPRKPNDPAHIIRLEDLRHNIEEFLGHIWAAARRILVLGPLPRYRHDAGKVWSDCPGFLAQQETKRACEEFLGADFLPLARAFTKSYQRWHLVGDDSERLFASDGVHLSAAGEDAVLQRIPQWLQWHE